MKGCWLAREMQDIVKRTGVAGILFSKRARLVQVSFLCSSWRPTYLLEKSGKGNAALVLDSTPSPAVRRGEGGGSELLLRW